MIKAFLKDSIIYTIPIVLSRGIGIFLLPIYTRITSPDELGALELFIAFGNIVALTVAFEITQGISRYIPESKGKLRRSYAFTGLIFTLVTYCLSISMFFLFADNLSLFITGSGDYLREFKLALIYILFNGFYYYFQNLLRFEGKSFLFSISSITYACSNLFLVLIFGIVLNQGLEAILNSLILSCLFVSLLSLFFLRNSFEKVFRFDLLRKLLAFSLPLVPASVLVFISLYINRFMINDIIGIQSVGLYSVGVKIASVTGLIIVGFQMAITPLIYKHYNDQETPKNLAIIFKYFVAIYSLFFISFSFLSKELVLLLTTEEFFEISSIIPILTLTFLFSSIYVFMPGIVIKKKTHIIFFINLVVAILNIILNLILIPKFNIIGAAYGTTLGYFFGFLMYIFFSQKFYHVNHNWGIYSLNFLLSVFFVFLYFNFFSESEYMLSILIRTSFVAILILFIIYTKLVSLDELYTLRNSLLQKFKK